MTEKEKYVVLNYTARWNNYDTYVGSKLLDAIRKFFLGDKS